MGIITALVSLIPLYSQLKKDQEKNLLFALKTRTLAIEEYLRRVKDVSRQIASRTAIRRKLELYNQGMIDLDELVIFGQPILDDALNQSYEVLGISRLDQTNKLVIQVGWPIPQKFWPLQAVEESGAVIGPVPIALAGQSLLVVKVPILNNQGMKVGRDIVLFKLEHLQKIVVNYTGLGETGETILGTIHNQQVQLFFPLRENPSKTPENLSQANAIGLAIEKGFDQETGILFSEKLHERNSVIAYAPIVGSDWSVAVKMSQEELYAPVKGEIFLIGSAILVLSLVGTSGMVLLLRPLTGKMIIRTDEVEVELERFFRLSIDLFCVAGRDNYFKRLNPAFEKTLGYKQKELFSQPFLNFVHPDDRAATQSAIEKLSASQSTVSFENRYRCYDGKHKWLAWNAFSVAAEGLIYAVARDITQIKQTEKSLEKSQTRLAGILNIAEDAIISVDARQIITLFNQGAEKLFGYSCQEVLGQSLDLLLPSRFADIDRRDIQEFGQSSEIARRMGERKEVFGLRRDGTEFPAEASISKLKLEDEVLFTLILRDISERKRAEEELADYSRTLEQKVQQRTKELLNTVEILKATQAELQVENALLRSDVPSLSFNYQIGGSLPLDAPTYVVRSADRQLYHALKAGQFCYILNARQMGKSSLMVKMRQRLKQEGFYCVALDMSAIGSENITAKQWYKGLVVQLWRSFNLSKKVNLKSWWQEREELPLVQCLRQFIEQVLFVELRGQDETKPPQLVIFLDEIDSVLSLKFPVNDFFALIRFCYNQRSLEGEYQRLTWALFGVASPSDLIRDYQRTPFNIGQAIELEGFQEYEAQPLLQGLRDKISNPQTVLKQVLTWTGGQPLLTQKLCKLLRDSPENIPTNQEAEWIENLVRSKIIDNWQSTDQPEHLRTIRNRIFHSDSPSRLLKLYRQILERTEVAAVDSPEERELLLSGLVVKQGNSLKVRNQIYQLIFNQSWVELNLAKKGISGYEKS